MSVQVKICGLTNASSLDAALEAGADYFGLVFYPASPRNVSHETARALAERGRTRALSVALLVDPDDDALTRVLDEVDPGLVQLHGQETPERVREVKERARRPVIKAVRVAGAADVEAARVYRGIADFILYDAKAPEGANALPGGNGVPFDWRALMGVKAGDGFLLSGGLDPDNVAQAIAATGAVAVDVSSGVERAPGKKDGDLIRRFVAAAKSAR